MAMAAAIEVIHRELPPVGIGAVSADASIELPSASCDDNVLAFSVAAVPAKSAVPARGKGQWANLSEESDLDKEDEVVAAVQRDSEAQDRLEAAVGVLSLLEGAHVKELDSVLGLSCRGLMVKNNAKGRAFCADCVLGSM